MIKNFILIANTLYFATLYEIKSYHILFYIFSYLSDKTKWKLLANNFIYRV